MNDEELADFLHANLCRLNHTDDCAWGYENSPNYPADKWTHNLWLKRAKDVNHVMQDYGRSRSEYKLFFERLFLALKGLS